MKKNILILLALMVFSVNQAQEIKWMSMDEALAAQKNEPRQIILDAYTYWCGWCKKMDRDTFKKPKIAEYINKNFYAVKFNAEGNETVNYQGKAYTNANFNPAKIKTRNGKHAFTSLMGVSGYPAIVFFDTKSNMIAPFPGYRDPKGMEVVLKMIRNEDYKNIKTQKQYQEYVKAFNYTLSK